MMARCLSLASIYAFRLWQFRMGYCCSCCCALATSFRNCNAKSHETFIYDFGMIRSRAMWLVSLRSSQFNHDQGQFNPWYSPRNSTWVHSRDELPERLSYHRESLSSNSLCFGVKPPQTWPAPSYHQFLPSIS
jgi:hypothetical protein